MSFGPRNAMLLGVVTPETTVLTVRLGSSIVGPACEACAWAPLCAGPACADAPARRTEAMTSEAPNFMVPPLLCACPCNRRGNTTAEAIWICSLARAMTARCCSARELANRVASPDRPALDDLCIDAAQVERDALWRVDELPRLCAVAFGELPAAEVREIGHFDNRGADLHSGSGWEVLGAQIEVDVELIAGERPALVVARDQRRGAGVHERQLRFRIGPLAARAPRVADQSALDVQLGLPERFAFADRGSPRDQLDRSVVVRGRTDLVEPGLKMLGGRDHGVHRTRRKASAQLGRESEEAKELRVAREAGDSRDSVAVEGEHHDSVGA